MYWGGAQYGSYPQGNFAAQQTPGVPFNGGQNWQQWGGQNQDANLQTLQQQSILYSQQQQQQQMATTQQMADSSGKAFDEKAFDAQFAEWEKQYETWKEQNKNHPDKTAFEQYDTQWQQWKTQLLERRKMLGQQSSSSGTEHQKDVSKNNSSNPQSAPPSEVPMPGETTEKSSSDSSKKIDNGNAESSKQQNSDQNTQQQYNMSWANQYNQMSAYGYYGQGMMNQQPGAYNAQMAMMGGYQGMSGNQMMMPNSDMQYNQSMMQGFQGNYPNMGGNQQSGNEDGTSDNQNNQQGMSGNQYGMQYDMSGNQYNMPENQQGMGRNQFGNTGDKRMSNNQRNQQGFQNNDQQIQSHGDPMGNNSSKMNNRKNRVSRWSQDNAEEDKGSQFNEDQSNMSNYQNARMRGGSRGMSRMRGNQREPPKRFAGSVNCVPLGQRPRAPRQNANQSPRLLQRLRDNNYPDGEDDDGQNFGGANQRARPSMPQNFNNNRLAQDNFPAGDNMNEFDAPDSFQGPSRGRGGGFRGRGGFNQPLGGDGQAYQRGRGGNMRGRSGMRQQFQDEFFDEDNFDDMLDDYGDMAPYGGGPPNRRSRSLLNLPYGRGSRSGLLDHPRQRGGLLDHPSGRGGLLDHPRGRGGFNHPGRGFNQQGRNNRFPDCPDDDEGNFEGNSEMDGSDPHNENADLRAPDRKRQGSGEKGKGVLQAAVDQLKETRKQMSGNKNANSDPNSIPAEENSGSEVPDAKRPRMQGPAGRPGFQRDDMLQPNMNSGRGRNRRQPPNFRGPRNEYNDYPPDYVDDDFDGGMADPFNLDDPYNDFPAYEDWWLRNRVWEDPYYAEWMEEFYPHFCFDPYEKREPLPPIKGFYHFQSRRMQERDMDWSDRDSFGPHSQPSGRMPPMRDSDRREGFNKERRPRDPVISIDYGHKSTKEEEELSSKSKEAAAEEEEAASAQLSGSAKSKDKQDPADSTKRNQSQDSSRDKKKEDGSKPDSARYRDSRDFRDAKLSHDKPPEPTRPETVLIEDLLCHPGRLKRPRHILVILRGLPGSGKSFVAKLIKEKEIENGGSAPRMLCLDDYFMVEKDKQEIDPDTGRKIMTKEMVYEYEAEMEPSYRQSLFKSLKKNVDNGLHPFIIIDAPNEKIKYFGDFQQYAKSKGYSVYIAEMETSDPAVCFKKNIHGRTLHEITKIVKSYQSTPGNYGRVDIRWLLQDASITEVEMEDHVSNEDAVEEESKAECEDEEPAHGKTSKWEVMEATEGRLDKLDGLKKKSSQPQGMEDYLQVLEDYEQRESQPGKKRVRWRDLEERRNQERARAIGFVVGQTDWDKITDPDHAQKALTHTKYI